MVSPFPSMYIPEWLFCWQGASCGPREYAAPRCSLGMVRARSAVSWPGLSVLGDSCGHPELPRRDADYALEVMRELALVREPGPRRDLGQGGVGPCSQEVLGPLDAASNHVLVGRQPRGRLELPRKVVAIEAGHGRYLGQGRGGVEVLLDVLQDGPEPPPRQGTVPPAHSAAGYHDVPDQVDGQNGGQRFGGQRPPGTAGGQLGIHCQ